RIKSNISLDATTANLTLDDNANQYLLRTANDFQNQLDVIYNINLTGGVWNGNQANQAININYANSLDTDFYGWGIDIINSENVKVHDLEIGNTFTWGISHINCNEILFDNIFINQTTTHSNGDGITGSSSNLTLNNIYGICSDNIIGIHSEVLGFEGRGVPKNETYFPPVNIENVTITNVRKYESATIYSASAVINNVCVGGFYA